MFHVKQFIGFHLFLIALSLSAFTGCSYIPWIPHMDIRADIEEEYFKFRQLAIDNQYQISPGLWEILVQRDKEVMARLESLKRRDAIYLTRDALPLILGVYGILGKDENAEKISMLIREATK